MALIVEDGTGKPDANSYAAVADADAYFLARKNAAWIGTNDAKEAALIQASDYIEARYWGRFVGAQKTATQALSWPRTGAGDYDDDEIPAALKNACIEYAVRALTAPLAPDPVVSESGVAMVTTREEVVGAVVVEHEPVARGQGSSPLNYRPYPAADMLIARLLVSGARVIRA